MLQEFILADLRAKGKDVTEEPEMEMLYNESRDGLSRKARECEEPNVKFEPEIGAPKSPEFMPMCRGVSKVCELWFKKLTHILWISLTCHNSSVSAFCC